VRDAKNEAHAAALLRRFITRAQAKRVQFTAQHVNLYSVDESIVDEAKKTGTDMMSWSHTEPPGRKIRIRLAHQERHHREHAFHAGTALKTFVLGADRKV